MDLTEDLIKKVLTTVDAGLRAGLGQREPGNMCVEAAVCYALGEPHGDQPSCVAPSLIGFKIALNDQAWGTRKSRAAGLRRLSVAQLGSDQFSFDVLESALKTVPVVTSVPRALRLAGTVFPSDFGYLEALAQRCEDPEIFPPATLKVIMTKVNELQDRPKDTRTSQFVSTLWTTVNHAIVSQSNPTAGVYVAVGAGSCAGFSTPPEKDPLLEHQRVTRLIDRELSIFAEATVQALVRLGVPGTKWLFLTTPPDLTTTGA